MVAYKNLIVSPVFECDGLWYLRVAEQRAIVLKHIDSTPIRGFGGSWVPVFVYTGLSCVHLLAFERSGAQATWVVAPDGRRLGDKLADLLSGVVDQLRDAVRALGLAQPYGLLGEGLQFIEPVLLRDILDLGGDGPPARGRPVLVAATLPAMTGLAMLAAPHDLRVWLRFDAHAPLAGDARSAGPVLALQAGWALDAASGASRAVGPLSTAAAGPVPPASRHLLTLGLQPLPESPERGGEQPFGIDIVVCGHAIAHVQLHPKWQSEGAELAFWLPPEKIAGMPFEIAFRHERSFSLTSLTLSQAGTRGAARLDPAELMARFENIGDNCEFGLVQRYFKSEPIGLLRFAGLRNPRRLIRFLNDDFGNFGEPGSLGTTIIGGEYWIIDHVYGIAYHTFRYQHEYTAEQVIRENEPKASYLKRKLREDLEDGEKILVYKRVVTQDPHEMIALHAALNRYGTVNKLLWVTQADEAHAPGDVEWVGDRLLKGYVASISLSNAHDFDPEIWLRLCRNALAAFEAVSSS